MERITKRRTWKRRAAVMVEYAFLITAVAIPTILGLVAGGKLLLANYQSGRSWMIQPVP